jgi:hypothetical protein
MNRHFTIFLLLIIQFLRAQECGDEWNDSTYYYLDDIVSYSEKNYKALATVWFLPPPTPTYWEEVPLTACYAEEQNDLVLNLDYQDQEIDSNRVIVNPGPGGVPVIRYSDSSFDYTSNTQVTLTFQPWGNTIFRRWRVLYFHPEDSCKLDTLIMENPLTLTVFADSGYYKIFAEFSPPATFDLHVFMPDTGNVTFNCAPDGKIYTWDKAEFDKVFLEYTEGDTVQLTVNTPPYYEFLGWGDENTTQTNPYTIAFTYTSPRDIVLTPFLDFIPDSLKFPKECDTANHIRVSYRSAIYGRARFDNGLSAKGGIVVKNKNGDRSMELWPDRILGNGIFLKPDTLGAWRMESEAFTTGKVDFAQSVKAKCVVAERVRVDSDDFPDYVFDKDYPLPSLDSLRSHIETNGRLPDMPPAAEVRKNGLDMAWMCKALVKKIEELSLQVIRLHQKIGEIEHANR